MRTAVLPLIEIAGDARERGRQYGETAREQIGRSLAYYREMYVEDAGGAWEEALASASERIPAIEKYAPGLLEEVRGIAEGAARTFEDILWLNGRIQAGRDAKHPPQDGCTSFALLPDASGDGHVYCGQNWDWRQAIRDTIVFLRIVQPPRPTIVMQVEAGQIGRQGANAAGIALNANALPKTPASRAGVPGPYIRRRALDSWTMGEAVHAIASAPRSGSANFLLAQRDGDACDLETTADAVTTLAPESALLVHGNHFAGEVPREASAVDRPWTDSLFRVPRMTAALREGRTAASARDAIAAGLRDHFGHPRSVCRHADPMVPAALANETLVSSIVDLTAGEYWVALGPPCEREYQRLPWSLYQERVS